MKVARRYTRYLVGIGLLLGTLLISTLASLVLLKSRLTAHHEELLRLTHALIPAEKMRSALETYVASDRGFLLTADPAFVERLATAESDFERWLSETEKSTKGVIESRRYEETRALKSQLRSPVQKMIAMRRAEGTSARVLAFFQNEVFPARLRLEEQVDSILSDLEGTIIALEEQARSSSSSSVGNVILLSVASNLVLIFLGLMMTRNLGRLYLKAKASEEKIQRLADDLSRSNIELEHFASVASHDMRAPLNTIVNFGTLLRRRLAHHEDQQSVEYLDYVTDGAKRLRTLVDDLLEFARLSSDTEPLHTVDLEKIVSEVRIGLASEIASHDATIITDALPSIVGNPTRLRQLFQNLISNSINYRQAEEPPQIRIEARRSKSDWVITVSDNGMGIERPYFERVFEPFKRLHGQERPGTGLGLPICRNIVEQLGGRIWIESEVEVGTKVFILLPTLARVSEPVPAAAVSLAPDRNRTCN